MHCRKRIHSSANPGGILGAILIILLPKCPMCLMAYGGAVAMCSGEALISDGELAWRAFLILSCSTLVLYGLLQNHRGSRTHIALALSLMGMSLLAGYYLAAGSLAFYWTGTILLFTGIWVNGSFLYIYRFLIHHLYSNHKNSTIA